MGATVYQRLQHWLLPKWLQMTGSRRVHLILFLFNDRVAIRKGLKQPEIHSFRLGVRGDCFASCSNIVFGPWSCSDSQAAPIGLGSCMRIGVVFETKEDLRVCK